MNSKLLSLFVLYLCQGIHQSAFVLGQSSNSNLSTRQRIRNFVNTPTSKQTIIQIVNDINELLENENTGKIIAGTTFMIKNILTDNVGSNSAIRISNGIHDFLTDESCGNAMKFSIDGIMSVMGSAVTAEFVKSETIAVTEFMQIPNAPLTTKAIGDGLFMIVNQNYIGSLIMDSSKNLAWIMNTDFKSMIPGMGRSKSQNKS